MRAADAGAMGVICPTVNTKAECEQFVGALRYAPLGYRSLGPNRARFLGDDYTAKANETILAIVQIETAPGLENVEAIASVKGPRHALHRSVATWACRSAAKAAWIRPTPSSSPPSTAS